MNTSSLAFAALSALTFAQQACAQNLPKYTMTVLETGTQYSWAVGINQSGQVLGTGISPSSPLGNYVISQGQLVNLGHLSERQSTEVFGINNAGQVVGASANSNGQRRAVLFEQGQVKELGTLGGDYSHAKAINNKGQVVGESYTADNKRHAFIYSNGQMNGLGQDLSAFGAVSSTAHAINDQGVVVGRYADENWNSFAFVYANNQVSKLDIFGSTTWSEAAAINQFGAIAGSYQTASGDVKAFFHKDGKSVDLGDLGSGFSTTTGMNNAGWVVGWSQDANWDQLGFVYNGQQMLNVNQLLAGSDWVVNKVTGINDKGQMVGVARNSQTNVLSAVLLNPVQAVPEPGTVALMLAGLASLVLVQRRRKNT